MFPQITYGERRDNEQAQACESVGIASIRKAESFTDSTNWNLTLRETEI